MKFLDFFAGIGGFRLGMERAGHQCVGYVEIDKFARISYQAMHDTVGEWTATDITKVTDDEWGHMRGSVDIICGGFPCQAFSIAGKRLGFEDTRGTLFFEIARAAKQIKPQILFLENVRGLLSHDKGRTFATIINTMDELGYDVEWQVLNSKDFGVPQNRERVFIIGHSREASRRKVFPIGKNNESLNSRIDEQPSTYTITSRYTGNGNGSYVIQCEQKEKVRIADFRFDEGLRIRKNNLSPTLRAGMKGNDISNQFYVIEGQNSLRIREATKKGYAIAEIGDTVNFAFIDSKLRRGRVGKGIANTIDTNVQMGVFTENMKIRRLTPKECFRLQGFPDELFEKAQAVNSENQLYKQAGNSVTVNVIHEIAKRLK
jgi:DNA (cytosine-5)-methyltransferase 1